MRLNCINFTPLFVFLVVVVVVVVVCLGFFLHCLGVLSNQWKPRLHKNQSCNRLPLKAALYIFLTNVIALMGQGQSNLF